MALVSCQYSKTWKMTEQRAYKNKAHTVFHPSHTLCWFASTPPIRMVIQLAHNQSENPMAQMANSHNFSDFACWIRQTLSIRFQKPPAQLNTPNRFVPDLVRLSPNAWDARRLAQCVSGLTHSGSTDQFPLKKYRQFVPAATGVVYGVTSETNHCLFANSNGD